MYRNAKSFLFQERAEMKQGDCAAAIVKVEDGACVKIEDGEQVEKKPRKSLLGSLWWEKEDDVLITDA